MKEVNFNVLNPARDIYIIIGNLCNKPELLREKEIALSESDFHQELHKITFNAISNIFYSNSSISKITEIDIDNYLASYKTPYKVWDEQSGLEFVRNSMIHANEDIFKSSYDKVKKFSLLRLYVEKGIDISDLYDYKSVNILTLDEGMKKIDSMSVTDILNHYSLKMMDIKDQFKVGQETKNFIAGEDLDTLLEDLNREPEYGYPFMNGFYNAIFRGMRFEKLMLRSAGTGTGKTRQALADICNVAIDEIYDIDKNCWKSNGPSYPALFISTELEKREIQTILLAYISGINEAVIKDGRYSEGVKNRLLKAIEILKRAPIFCEYVNDFSIADIESIIERYILQHNTKFIAFDYIQMTPKLSRSMSKAFGSSLREDQILVQFTGALKILANKYKVYITSSTQLNRSAKEAENRDTTALRGGSAQADKVDFGLITFKVSQKDRDNLNHILERGFYQAPNYSHWVYKNRSGRSNIIIWTYMDLGTMREIPLFVTDTDYCLLSDIEVLNIDNDISIDDETMNELPKELIERIKEDQEQLEENNEEDLVF